MNMKADLKPKLKNPYPGIDFQRAYEYLLKIKKQFPSRNIFERKELLERGLGFPENHGTGHNVVGSLAHYGLVWRETTKNQTCYRVTSTALQLLAAEEDHDKWKIFALEAATSPVVFDFLFSKYNGQLPLGVDDLLIRKYPEVTSKNVGAIIYRYKVSLKFVEADGSTNTTATATEVEVITDKIHKIDMGNGIIMSIPEKTLREIIKTSL